MNSSWGKFCRLGSYGIAKVGAPAALAPAAARERGPPVKVLPALTLVSRLMSARQFSLRLWRVQRAVGEWLPSTKNTLDFGEELWDNFVEKLGETLCP